ncbi:MAG TPA: sugar transferase [Candidatus Saccharimonadales bacterium]|nr:sugar transferase [Candidatus Saccharimonadales bacterium]
MSRGIEYLQGPEKRGLDLTVSSILSLPALGIAGLTAAALNREVGGWRNSLFMQKRVVGDGEIIIPKLRTLHPDKTQGRLVSYGPQDPRAGTMGRFVRQVGLDETLQMLSVLRGDMSMVGPRPRPQLEFEEYEQADPVLFEEWNEAYHSMKPGIFGSSQLMRHGHAINGTDEIRVESMRMELQYAEEAALATDLRILIGAIPGIPRAAVSAYAEAA